MAYAKDNLPIKNYTSNEVILVKEEREFELTAPLKKNTYEKNKQNAFILKVTKLPHIHVKMDNRALISAPAKKKH